MSSHPPAAEDTGIANVDDLIALQADCCFQMFLERSVCVHGLQMQEHHSEGLEILGDQFHI